MEVILLMNGKTIIQSIQNKLFRCCSNTPNFEIIYENGKKWLVCSSCFKSKPWNRFIKSKVEIDLKKI